MTYSARVLAGVFEKKEGYNRDERRARHLALLEEVSRSPKEESSANDIKEILSKLPQEMQPIISSLISKAPEDVKERVINLVTSPSLEGLLEIIPAPMKLMAQMWLASLKDGVKDSLQNLIREMIPEIALAVTEAMEGQDVITKIAQAVAKSLEDQEIKIRLAASEGDVK